jgi:hypothetical protein
VNAHIAASWAFLALELWSAGGDAGERARYRAVLEAFTKAIRDRMRPNPADPAAVLWTASLAGGSSPQDVSHGNAVVAFAVEAHRLGVGWTDADMRGLVRTLRDHVWRPGGGFAGAVDGSGSGNGWLNDGFAKLGRFDAVVQKRLERHAVGRNVQLYGNGALNARILSGR